MFSFRNDPGADGVGIAFFDAVGARGERLDLSVGGSSTWRAPDWDEAEAALGVPILNAKQVHSARVLLVDSATDRRALVSEPADGLVTLDRGLGLAVRAADCLPVLFADAEASVVAAVHAGRVGLGLGVLGEAVARMRTVTSAALRAWIGPHICGQCYEVPDDLRTAYCADLPAAWGETSWGTPSLDLGAAAQEQLQRLGCQVVRVDPCTRTTSTLYSYRRDGVLAGRQAGVIWLPSDS